MATPHLSGEEITGFFRRTLAPNEILAVDEHLEQCGQCREALQKGQSLESISEAVVASLLTDTVQVHPEFEEIAEYVDGTITDGDRSKFETHLENCTNCLREVEDLKLTQASLATSGSHIHKPKVVDITGPRTASRTIWNRYRIGLAAAAAVLLAVTVVFVVVYTKSGSSTNPDNQHPENNSIATVNTGPSPLKTASPTPSVNATPGVAEARVELEDGGAHLSMGSDQKLEGLDSAPSQIKAEIESAFKTGHLKTSTAASDLGGRSGKLMGTSDSTYGLGYPVAIVIETESPKFRWLPVDGAKGYVVTVFDSDSRKVVSSDPIQITSWRLPARLDRGKVYTWQVRAIKDTGEVLMPPPASPDAKFKVLDASRVASMAELRKSFPRSHLILGVAYLDAGLLSESVSELKELVAENPKSPLAQSLLRSAETQLRENQKR